VQTTNTAYKQAVANAERVPVADVRVDWTRSGQPVAVRPKHIRISRAITSDLSPEATLITGYATAEAEVHLAGDPNDNTHTAAAVYSPYRSDAALADIDPEGLPVTVKLGIAAAGQDPLTNLVGAVRDLNMDAGPDGSAAYLTALDGAQGMAFTPALPLIVAADAAGGLQPGLNSSWIADAIFRQGGYYASPGPRGIVTGDPASHRLSATLHGCAAPDPYIIGASGLVSAQTASGGPIQYVPVKWGLGTKPDPVDGAAGTALYSLNLGLSAGSGSHIAADMWIIPAVASYPLGDLSIRDAANTASSRIRITNNGTNYILRLADAMDVTGPALTNPTQVHYLGVHLAFSGGDIQVTWRIDGTTTGPTAVGSNPILFSVQPAQALLKTYNSVEALQISVESSPAWNDAYVPTAVVEPGLNELVAMPAISTDQTARDVVQKLAAAEGAMVLFDETGKPQFWTRAHWGAAAAANTVQRTLTAVTALKTVTIGRLADRVRNVIKVAYTPVTVRAKDTIWTLNENILIPPKQSVTRTVDLSPDQAYQVDTTGGVMPSGGPMINGQSSYRATKANSDGSNTGVQVSNLTMMITPTAVSVKIVWTNPNRYPVLLVTPSTGYPAASVGLPTSALVGQLVTAQGLIPDVATAVASGNQGTAVVEVRCDPSVTVYGERFLAIDNNPWRQTGTVAEAVGRDILHAIAWPCPQLSQVTVVGDPALLLGDRVQMQDDSGQTGLSDPFWIVGKIDTFEGGDTPTFSQDLTLRPAARPRQLILGVAGRSELGGPDSQL